MEALEGEVARDSTHSRDLGHTVLGRMEGDDRHSNHADLAEEDRLIWGQTAVAEAEDTVAVVLVEAAGQGAGNR